MDDEFEEEKANAGGIGIRPLEIAVFVLLSARKHLVLSVAAFLLISVPGVLVARVFPHEYYTRARVLVAAEGIRARVLTGGMGEAAADLHAIQDKTFREENLRGIVRDMNLEKSWAQRRPPLLAFKDRVRGGIANLSQEDRIRTLMGTVQKRITINADQYAGVLTVEGVWTDPQTAYELVQTVMTRYLDERLRAEVQVFEEVLTILEQQKRDAAHEVEMGLGQVERASWQPAAAPTAIAPVGEPAGTPGRSPTLETVREVGTADPTEVARLDEIRKQIRDIQEPWQRRLGELKLQLSDLSTHYGPKHPLVVNQEARIREASVAPPGLEVLRADESRLAASIADASRPRERIVLKNRSNGPSPASTTSAVAPAAEDKGTRIESSATLSTEQSKLMSAISKYNALVDRIDRTRMELNTASTAFKYRFTIVQKPEVPQAPIKPKMPMMIAIGAIVAGALIALLIGPLRELLGGKILAPWQAKTLGIPVLGELPLVENEPN